MTSGKYASFKWLSLSLLLSTNIAAYSSLDQNDSLEIVGLIYHRFGDPKYPSTNISTNLFEQHLKYLVDHRIQCITFSEAINLLREKNAKGRYCVITIDDAFKSFYKNGYPLIKKYNLKATLFLNTSTIDGGDYMSFDEIKEVLQYGIELGNHTHGHQYFLNEGESGRKQAFEKDILKSEELLYAHFGVRPTIFAYPYGEYDESMQKVLVEKGFRGAAAQHSGIMSTYSDLYALPRFPMTDVYGEMNLFKQKIHARHMAVEYVKGKNTLSLQNPPVLQIKLLTNGIDLNRIQCFIQGGSCNIQRMGPDGTSLEIVSGNRLNQRRHLYTLTYPGTKKGEWYWFSHLWIFPDRP